MSIRWGDTPLAPRCERPKYENKALIRGLTSVGLSLKLVCAIARELRI
ncbi:hypothetical protein HCG48_13510 [Oxynema aestuarii AP17]|uniref:Uncharacterized protein n=1 Tax=Oxynema aestuarii AP17 TaxID=2064643 RepID=A0A6H1TXZ6_9CYAN|nr:hypothetical protein HCG48_13510 [Oxynema aestuarii AP17]